MHSSAVFIYAFKTLGHSCLQNDITFTREQRSAPNNKISIIIFLFFYVTNMNYIKQSV